MSLKMVPFSLDEFVVDTDGVQEALNHACARGGTPREVMAVCQVGDNVLFILENGAGKPPEYRFVFLQDLTRDGFVSLVNERYQGGHDPVGTVTVRDSVYVLFRTSR